MYLYEHFMRFGGVEKSIVHGGSMMGFGCGALIASRLTRWLDKKGAVIFAGLWTVGCNTILAVLFLPGIIVPGESVTILSWPFPVAFAVFGLLHGFYWMGNGVIFPTSLSMMADVSEIQELVSGANKDGAYAAAYSFANKAAISVAVLASGYGLTLIGFEPGKEVVQRPEVLWRLCAATLLAGPVISLISLASIRRYRVDNGLLIRMRSGHGKTPGSASAGQ
jgi:Na+/melibiose symporter-like transporter